MKLYYMPGACSIGIHVLLEEIGKPYDLQKIDGAKQEQYGPDFVKINPKSKVPTLQRDDGSVLTEFPAIATWLATPRRARSRRWTTSCRPCTCRASAACSGR
jgi:glutathione S-transferase